MLEGRKIVVTMPAYWAEKTLERTVSEIPRSVVGTIILVDDASKDATFEIAQRLGLSAYQNEKNLNYGGNVKRCLTLGVESGADIIILLHPDCQYPPRLVTAMGAMMLDGTFDLCLASRMTGKGALTSGMPVYKHLSNILLTALMNVCFGRRHSEYHTGYRAYTSRLLKSVDLTALSNDFCFDNELYIAAIKAGFDSCEVTCPTRYDDETSSISFKRSVVYGIACVRMALRFLGWRLSGGRPARRGRDPDAIPG